MTSAGAPGGEGGGSSGDDARAEVGQPTAANADRTVRAEDISAVLTSIGETVYAWDVRADRISWSANAAELLHVPSLTAIDSGEKFSAHLDLDDQKTLRGQGPVAGQGSAPDHGYQTQYTFLPRSQSGPRRLWLEDVGHWTFGEDGLPAFAYGVVRVINDRRAREEKLDYLCSHDPLTGLLNRSALTDALSEIHAAVTVGETNAAFLLAAVDNLSVINESFGFDVADQALCAVAKRLSGRLRRRDVIGRYSGNKFGLVLFGCNADSAEMVADRLMGWVRETPVDTRAGPVPVTLSVGGVILPSPAHSPEMALLCAQEALSEAKLRHRDSFVMYKRRKEQESARRRNMQIADSIVLALNDGRIGLAFQPIVSAADERIEMYECLVRLRQEDGTELSAAAFVPTAEKLDLGRLLDHRVLDLAVAELCGDPALRLCVNIFADTTMDRAWLDHLRAGVAGSQGIAERLVVEITETAAIHDIEESNRFMKAVRELGCKVAIDDFGAGYTSFRNLKLLDVDMVKIDGSFIARLSREPDDQLFVRLLIDLARNFGIATVAEWVSSAEDAALLKSWGVDYLQGSYFGEAQTPETVHAEPAPTTRSA